MQSLTEAHGVRTMLRALSYVALRLRRYPEAVAIANELVQRRKDLSEAEEAFDLAHTAGLAANAEVSYRDNAVDCAVMTLAGEALRWVGKDAQDPRYVALFPIDPERAMASTAGPKQNEFVQQLLSTLRGSDEFRPLLAHADVLERKQQALERALTDRDACSQPEREAATLRAECARLACLSYNRSPARLQLLFTDGALIESFFPVLQEAGTRDSSY